MPDPSLGSTITHDETAQTIDTLGKSAIPAEAIAEAVAYAIGQPDSVDVNEIIVRPTVQAL